MIIRITGKVVLNSDKYSNWGGIVPGQLTLDNRFILYLTVLTCPYAH